MQPTGVHVLSGEAVILCIAGAVLLFDRMRLREIFIHLLVTSMCVCVHSLPHIPGWVPVPDYS